MNNKVSEQQAIDNLTRQTDYRGLCAHLIAAVNNLFDANAKLYEAHDDDGRLDLEALDRDKTVLREFPNTENLAHPPWLSAILDSIDNGKGLDLIEFAPPQSLIMNIGNLNGVWRFLIIGKELNESERKSLQYVVIIFQNMLGLLDRFERDALTGLLNRQSFDYRFEDLLEHHQRNPNRAVKSDSISWLAIADIDRFKVINDTYGHLFGDEILLITARLIQDCFRFDDLIFRYGGEEFIIILNNTDAPGAILALERLRTNIESYDFPTVGQVTISIGWTAVIPNVPANSIIHRADRALYHAKALGRNKTISFEEYFDESEEDNQ
ncbi:MAG: GGDEF domain-containing protein [Gammaproteobacteria bacterium]